MQTETATTDRKRAGPVINVVLDDELIGQLDRLANADERSRSGIIRVLLREAMRARMAAASGEVAE